MDWDNVARGLTIFILGLAKKILIADQLSPYVALVFDAAAAGQPIGAAAAWGASIAYSLQLYFDFSGYSDMAVGLGLLFNLRLPVNFAAPLRSTSIIDLWRRWHISLSRFLRDFIYVPLGGGRGGGLRRSTNLFLTMVIGGLWHGANWTFIAWGAFHGVLLTINHAWRFLRGDRQSTLLSRSVGWILTFLAFAVGMTMFRSANIETAASLLQAMAGFGPGASDAGFNPGADFSFIKQGLRIGGLPSDMAWRAVVDLCDASSPPPRSPSPCSRRIRWSLPTIAKTSRTQTGAGPVSCAGSRTSSG